MKFFDWKTAERVDLSYTFIHQPEFVFININIKGYKEEDVHYAFSADEIVIEIRDRAAKRVHQIQRLCQTLSKQIDVPASNVQFLIDFITIKFAKVEKSATWSNLGYNIADFTNPLRG